MQQLGHMQMRYVLPDTIDDAVGSAVRQRVQARVKGPIHLYRPEVAIAFAMSQRKGIDDDGNGPAVWRSASNALGCAGVVCGFVPLSLSLALLTAFSRPCQMPHTAIPDLTLGLSHRPGMMYAEAMVNMLAEVDIDSISSECKAARRAEIASGESYRASAWAQLEVATH